MEKTMENKIQNKKSFILYLDQAEIIDELSDDEAGKLFKGILYYVHTGNDPELPKLLKMAFIPIKQSLHRDLEKWRQERIIRSEAGKLGGLAKQANARLARSILASSSKSKQSLANQAVNVNVSVNGIKYKYIGEFEKLWDEYPKKDGKKEALKHFTATVLTEGDVANISKALINYKKYISGIDYRFIKNGSTWFNNWQDWVEYNPKDLTENQKGRVYR